MRLRHPIEGIDARRTSNADHAAEASAVASLTVALITLGALAFLVALVASIK